MPNQAIVYHDRTKHRYHRFAPSPGFLDWANQPNPFRRYDGAQLLRFSMSTEDDSPPYDLLYRPGAMPEREVSAHRIGWLFEHALALSAWKEFMGSRWELRCNPSSGNLHPTEGYLVADVADGPGVFHYAPQEHGLERRTRFDDATWREMMTGFPRNAFLVGLASIHWREAWKYGERAFRYCNHDAGHAFAALSLSAAALGWRVVLLEALGDDDVAGLLGLERPEDTAGAEAEHPDLLAVVVSAGHGAPVPTGLPRQAIEAVAAGQWFGRPNRLSTEHVDWAIIPETAAACRKPATPAGTVAPLVPVSGGAIPRNISARRLFLQRRSATEMDGHSTLGTAAFYHLLERTMPVKSRPPWHGNTGTPCAHLLLFVHRVTGLAPGMYVLVRNAADEESLRAAFREEFVWTRPSGCPDSLPLYQLHAGDFRAVARQVSCTQDIAADGAFCACMLSQFEEPLREHGAWLYPRLFWETGMIGQVLYLEAEAAGLRGTGIGCFFDDAVHELLGIQDHRFQSLYHFTVGGPLDDPRLRSLPPYSRERRSCSDL